MALRKYLFQSLLCISLASSLAAETLPVSDDIYLNEQDLVGLDQYWLRIARNEIFARHGYKFNGTDLTRHFSQYSWYRPRTKNVSLSRLEQENVAFIKRYEGSPSLQARLIAPTPSPQATPNQTTQVVVIEAANSAGLDELRKEHLQLEKEIRSLRALLELQSATSEGENSIQAVAIKEIEGKINTREQEMTSVQASAESGYQTPIKPTEVNAQPTPRELSLSFPRVPWYRPEFSDSFGEFWLEPVVSDEGDLQYQLKFLDPQAENERILSEFALNSAETQGLRDGLVKAFDWSEIARDKNLRDIFQKEIMCVPAKDCAEKVRGNTSTQIDFIIFEGGATGARITRNKGAFQDKFGISIESAALLSAYFDFVIKAGEESMDAGSRTTEEIDDFFK